ncbi:hypothetical protein [Streptomyces sp. NPDC059881]|uniref:hypothetical protein n=1 Tax=Streptomyces sp. NPDC059881 TaxID=3346986 RepID=UPI00366243E2
MHSATTPFTLRPWKQGNRHERRSGWRGTSAEFGDITVTCPLPRNQPGIVISEVSGGSIPTASFESRGIHTDAAVLPTLNRATLRLGDALVHMTRNRWALTHRGRALHLKYGGDKYRLWAVNRRACVLSRAADDEDSGVTVTVKGSGRGKKRQMAVNVAGRAVAADIVLATLFAGIDRSTLTRRGTVRAAVSRTVGIYAESQY